MQEMNMIPTSVYILQGFNVNILDLRKNIINRILVTKYSLQTGSLE